MVPAVLTLPSPYKEPPHAMSQLPCWLDGFRYCDASLKDLGPEGRIAKLSGSAMRFLLHPCA